MLSIEISTRPHSSKQSSEMTWGVRLQAIPSRRDINPTHDFAQFAAHGVNA